MKSPSITIVTPTYNRCQALARAIDSVRAQTVSDYEHVIVDDGSTDNTGEMVAGYGDKRIRYFSLPHRCGANTARNLAIQKARAPVLGFLDSDDEYQPFRLQHTLDILEANPQTPLMLSSYAVQRKSGAGSAVNIGGVVGGENFERALAWRLVHIAGTSITARRDAARRIGGFNPVLRRNAGPGLSAADGEDRAGCSFRSNRLDQTQQSGCHHAWSKRGCRRSIWRSD